MLPVVDKPAIQYVVEEAVRAGIRDILIITGRGKRSLEDHFDRSFELEFYLEKAGRESDVAAMRAIAELANIHYVRQGEPKGLGHAVGVTRDHVGDEPFAVLLGDDLMAETSHVLEDMIEANGRTGASVIALKEFPRQEISAYGCVAVDSVSDPHELVRIRSLVEKPRAEDAPSNLAIMGRYVLTPAIFECIERVAPGRGGEIQLTDAMSLLLESEALWGLRFTDGRYDTGNKLDWLRATVELALMREDLGPGFRKYLAELAKREGFA
jgi:UTP--glucose-1-phosphate uridylyltransferase